MMRLGMFGWLLCSLVFMLAVPVAGAAEAPTMGGVFGAPLAMAPGRHAVIMEYEAWFGPDAITFYQGPGNVGPEANPILQSADMVGANGCPATVKCGYDSEDPRVIRTHVQWLRDMGVDGITLDDTNDGACSYDSRAFAEKYLQGTGCIQGDTYLWHSYWVHIGTNNAHLFAAWNALKAPLKIIPLLDAADPTMFIVDDWDGYSPHRTALEKEIGFYGALIAKHPGMAVLLDGKPLMLLFVAVNDPTPAMRFVAKHKALAAQYTFRIMGGYLDSQPQYWAPPAEQRFWKTKNPATPETPSGPTLIAPQMVGGQSFGLWSQVDRLNTTCRTDACLKHQCDATGCWATYPFEPSYSLDPTGRAVENFTVAVATAGAEASGTWGTPATATTPAQYFPDDSLRWDSHKTYVTLNSFMEEALKLKPEFLFVLQFNEFMQPDEGFDARTSNDLEPATALPSDEVPDDSWCYTGITAARDWMVRYREAVR